MALALVEPISSTAELARSIVLGVVEEAAHQARWLELVAEFDEREGYLADGVPSTSAWLGWKCGVEGRTARAYVQVARALRSLPITRARFAEGRLSYTKVRELVRIATPASELYLVAMAADMTASQFRETVSTWVKVEQPVPEAADEERRHRQCGADRWVDGEGLVHYELVVSPDEDLVIQRALETAAGRSYRARRSGASAAGASAAGASGGEGEGGAGADADPPPGLVLRGRERRLDAFLWLVRHGMQSGAGRDEPPENPVLLVLPVEQRQLVMDSDGMVDIGGGVVLHPRTVQRLGCGAAVNLALVGDDDPAGSTLDLGRATRLASRKQRQALSIRHRTCVFPGCEIPVSWCEIHHLQWWTKGGTTDLENLRPVCRFHHHLCHEGGWNLVLDGRGEAVAIAPDGRRERSRDALSSMVGEPGLRVDAGALGRRLRRHGFEPHDGSEISGRWGGERMNRWARSVVFESMSLVLRGDGPLRT